MIKAIFLDMDETLCDTSLADVKASAAMASVVAEVLPKPKDATVFTQTYVSGVYKRLSARYAEQLLPVIDEHQYRRNLIALLLADFHVEAGSDALIDRLQNTFDETRKSALGFYPGLVDVLKKWRKSFKLVVITNGPEFSQLLKIDAIHLRPLVDHIIIGGQEKEEKPAESIFKKALHLAGVEASEAIHFGDKLMTDVLGANDSGIPSVWISHGQSLDDHAGIRPTYTLLHPNEMDDLISRLK